MAYILSILKLLKSHNYNTRSAELKTIKTNNNRGGRSLFCRGDRFSACRHGRPGRAAVGGGIGQLLVGIFPCLLGEAMLLGRKGLPAHKTRFLIFRFKMCCLQIFSLKQQVSMVTNDIIMMSSVLQILKNWVFKSSVL